MKRRIMSVCLTMLTVLMLGITAIAAPSVSVNCNTQITAGDKRAIGSTWYSTASYCTARLTVVHAEGTDTVYDSGTVTASAVATVDGTNQISSATTYHTIEYYVNGSRNLFADSTTAVGSR